MKHVKSLVLGVFFSIFVAAPILNFTAPQVAPVSAACADSFLGIPTWYRGLTNAKCEVVAPTGNNDSLQTFIWTIVLNVIEMALVAIVYVAIFFILYGGFQFLVGGANPSMIEKARKTILNAVIGLVIAMGSIAVTKTLFSIITAGTTDNGIPTMSDEELLRNILNLVYFVAGTVSVVIIIISGLMYTISSGDAGRVTKGKNLLTYSIVGLIIILSAFTITNFVIGRFN